MYRCMVIKREYIVILNCVSVFGKDDFISAYSNYFKILKPGPQPLEVVQASEFVAVLFQVTKNIFNVNIIYYGNKK